jgi:hypothetical protein
MTMRAPFSGLKPSLGQIAQREEESADLIIGEPVLDVQALLFSIDEPRSAKKPIA